MSKVELLQRLYEYNEWSNSVILDAAAPISEADLAGEQTASHESIEGLLLHTLAAQILWLSRWKDEPFPGMPQVQEGRALESLREAYATSNAGLREFVGGLAEEEMERPTAMPEWIERMKGADLPLWQVMMQILQHGMHHRAEIQVALTALQHPVRDLDYILWEIDRRRS